MAAISNFFFVLRLLHTNQKSVKSRRLQSTQFGTLTFFCNKKLQDRKTATTPGCKQWLFNARTEGKKDKRWCLLLLLLLVTVNRKRRGSHRDRISPPSLFYLCSVRSVLPWLVWCPPKSAAGASFNQPTKSDAKEAERGCLRYRDFVLLPTLQEATV